MPTKRRSSSNLITLICEESGHAKIFKPSTSRLPVRKWTAPHEVLFDTFIFLERNEIEKCQLVSKDWNISVKVENHRLTYRDFKDHDLVVSNEKAFFLKNAPYKFDDDRSHSMESEKEILSLKYCYVMNVRVHEFNWNVWQCFDKIASKCRERLKARNFKIFGQFTNLSIINSLPQFFDEYVIADNLTIHLSHSEVRHVLANPISLRLPNKPENISIVDRYGETRIVNFDQERHLNLDEFLYFLNDPEASSGNRHTLLMTCMARNLIREDFIEKYVKMFEECPNPSTFFRMVEIWCFADAVFAAEYYLIRREFPQSKVIDTFPGPSYNKKFNTYTVNRLDGWSLRVMLEDSGCSRVKFWVLRE